MWEKISKIKKGMEILMVALYLNRMWGWKLTLRNEILLYCVKCIQINKRA